VKILLVQAKFTRYHNITNPPLGLMYISAVLKRGGFAEVRLLHLDAHPDAQALMRSELESFRPDVVGVGALTAQAPSLHEAAAQAKAASPGCLVVAGGPHPTLYYEECLRDRNIDLVVRGEGEDTFLEIVAARAGGASLAGIRGTCRREGEAFIEEPPREFRADLDTLPMPDWDVLDIASYDRIIPCSIFSYGSRHMPLITSRGCPYECVYCHHTMGKRYRAHSPERVLEEMLLLHGKYGVRFCEIMDDNVNLDRARFKKILRLLAERRPADLQVYLSYGLRADTLDAEAIDMFRAAGIPYFAIGIESGSKKIQALSRKNLDLGKVKLLVDHAASRRIFIHGLFMVGFPGETEEDIRETIEYACASSLHTCLISTCRVYKRTRLAEMVGNRGLMSEAGDVDSFGGYGGMPGSVNLSASRLLWLKFMMNLRFYYSPARVWRIFRDLPRYTPGLLFLLLKKLLGRSIPLE